MEKIIYFQLDENSKVTFIEFSDCENYIFIGCSSGRIYVYLLNQEVNKILTKRKMNFFEFGNLELLKIINDHKAKINWMYFCKKLNIFASVADDKSVNLYTFPNFVNFNVIQNSKFSFDYVFISSSPLPSLCLYSRSELAFYCYSINGTLISVEKDGVKNLLSPIISRDNSFSDYLVIFYLIFRFMELIMGV